MGSEYLVCPTKMGKREKIKSNRVHSFYIIPIFVKDSDAHIAKKLKDIQTINYQQK